MLFLFNIFIFGYFFINVLEKLNNTYNYNKIYTLTNNLPINNSLIMLYTNIKTNNPFLNNIILFLSSCLLFCLYNFFLSTTSNFILSISTKHENNENLIINELLNEHYENIIENNLFQLILNNNLTNNNLLINNSPSNENLSINNSQSNENLLNNNPSNENLLINNLSNEYLLNNISNENLLNNNSPNNNSSDNKNLLNNNPNNDNLSNNEFRNEKCLTNNLLESVNLINNIKINEKKTLIDNNLLNEDEILDISEIEFNNKGNDNYKIDEIKVIKICKKKVIAHNEI